MNLELDAREQQRFTDVNQDSDSSMLFSQPYRVEEVDQGGVISSPRLRPD